MTIKNIFFSTLLSLPQNDFSGVEGAKFELFLETVKTNKHKKKNTVWGQISKSPAERREGEAPCIVYRRVCVLRGGRVRGSLAGVDCEAGVDPFFCMTELTETLTTETKLANFQEMQLPGLGLGHD